jgi:two-component system NtrC family sensor kinase
MARIRFSLQIKIILIIASTVILVVGASTFTATWLTQEPVEEEIYRRAIAQARLTTPQLVDKDGLQSPENLLGALGQVEHDLPGWLQSDVFAHEPEHHLLVTTNPQGDHPELDNLPNVESYNGFFMPNEGQMSIETPDSRAWIISTTIRAQGRPVGCLVLKVSKSHLSALTLDLVRRNLLLMVGSLVVVILVIHIFFLKRVRGPVKEMIRVMEGAEGGQLNVRAGAVGGDEIGQLAEHLNRMLARIENFNTELGRKVEEATAELARRNEELARINQELFETQRTLARSERLAVAGQLAASLAHEIGTPLNSISGHVQLLARRASGDEALARRLQVIDTQIEHIVRTVKQLLSWTHTPDLHIAPLHLRQVLQEVILLSSPALQHRKIRVRLELASGLPEIYGDAGYLQQVFLNLINNSMDAMPQGGELMVGLTLNSDGQALQVVLEDTGHGMSKETRAHIFEPMFTTKRMGTGSGLGLAICDQIIRQHAGAISVESELGRGTRFTILLPLDCRGRAETSSPTASVVGSMR